MQVVKIVHSKNSQQTMCLKEINLTKFLSTFSKYIIKSHTDSCHQIQDMLSVTL